MPAVSSSQQHVMGMVHAYKSGALKLKNLPKNLAAKVKQTAKGISDEDASDFARTKTSHLPKHKKLKEGVTTLTIRGGGNDHDRFRRDVDALIEQNKINARAEHDDNHSRYVFNSARDRQKVASKIDKTSYIQESKMRFADYLKEDDTLPARYTKREEDGQGGGGGSPQERRGGQDRRADVLQQRCTALIKAWAAKAQEMKAAGDERAAQGLQYAADQLQIAVTRFR